MQLEREKRRRWEIQKIFPKSRRNAYVILNSLEKPLHVLRKEGILNPVTLRHPNSTNSSLENFFRTYLDGIGQGLDAFEHGGATFDAELDFLREASGNNSRGVGTGSDASSRLLKSRQHHGGWGEQRRQRSMIFWMDGGESEK